MCVRAHYLHSKCGFLTFCVCVPFVCNRDALNNLLHRGCFVVFTAAK